MVQTRASHTTHHKRSSTGHRLGVIPLKRAFSGWIAFEVEVVVHGVIMEVVVLATVVEVAVHAEVVELDGSVTRVFGDGSGTHVWEAVYGDGSRTC